MSNPYDIGKKLLFPDGDTAIIVDNVFHQDAPKENDPYFTGCGGCGADYPAICGCREVNQSIEDTLTLIAEQKELLANDKN